MEHLNQIQRAIDYIEDNLHNEMEIASVAKIAGFSTWHFQRVFCSSVGLTLKDYIRKRRLSIALKQLSDEKQRILDIALGAGFESQESFSRAFKSFFGKNPGECRKDGAHLFLSMTKPSITFEYLEHLNGGLTMQPRFEQITEKKFIGMSDHFISVLSEDKNNMIVIPALWGHFMQRKSEIKNVLGGQKVFGICACINDPKLKKHKDECFYMACVEVDSLTHVPEGMQSFIVPSGRFAVFTHKGQITNIEHTMKYIFGSWLAQSGEKLRDAADLEVYGDKFKLGSDDSELDIYIPIQ